MKNDSCNALPTASVVSESTDEQLDEKTQEMKEQIYGQCRLPNLVSRHYHIITVGVHFPFYLPVTDIIRTIKDPEKPATLEDLNVVYENGVEVCILLIYDQVCNTRKYIAQCFF